MKVGDRKNVLLKDILDDNINMTTIRTASHDSTTKAHAEKCCFKIL